MGKVRTTGGEFAALLSLSLSSLLPMDRSIVGFSWGSPELDIIYPSSSVSWVSFAFAFDSLGLFFYFFLDDVVWLAAGWL